ncbi:amidase [Amycolatopsis sp. K13G38]|uniref:Amidase n=1 Tax=Amycolatopsis acididurans TaxID=2724524 RepID=A0ABX1JGJ0_9PSEU|nr:amidase [Amycolatopsis acididurans]NKQ58907.1 amidase [Amycolatopsis acididurans]
MRLGAFVETYDGEGSPVAVKDLIDVRGQTVRSGTPGLTHHVAAGDASCWARLRAAGYYVMGRTSVPELAWSVRTPGCGNPWDPSRDAGGSSGGSAVAVATGAAPVALGTDTGGSIRIPAALCGVAGLRPTHGSIPMDGITPIAPSMDTVGPLALTARECLRLHELMSATPSAAPSTVAGLRVGLPSALWGDKIDPGVLRLVEEAATTVRDAGARIVDVELPLARAHARGAGYTTMLYESAQHWWQAYQDEQDGLAGRAIGLLRAGSQVSTSDYETAREQAAAVRDEVDAVFGEVDALLMPTVPVTAAPLDSATVRVGDRDEDIENAYYRLTALAAVSGHPALSVPAGLSDGLPVGAQIVGPRGQEALVCLLGEIIESGPSARDLARRRNPTG